MASISAVVLTKNEEDSIGRCLSSLGFCDEVIVIDDGSTDQTRSIAQEHGATVVEHELADDFSQQRTVGIEQASHDWVLCIDADEEVTPALATEITATLKTSSTARTTDTGSFGAYRIPRVDYWCGQKLSHGELLTAARSGFIRLMQKKSGQWKGTVHETFVTDGPVGQLKNSIIHRPHQSVAAFLESVNHYSTIRATELASLNHRLTLMEIVSVPLGKFLFTYLIRGGFRDGTPGFIYSFMMSFHSFLVRAKLYQYYLTQAS